MRRILAITLLIAFGSPLVLPALASPADPQRNLPACCRRNGIHHCTGMTAPGAENAPTFKAPPCPDYPTPATPVSLNALALAAPTAFAVETLVSPPPSAAIQPRAPASILSSNLQRGPPTLLA